MTPDIITKQFKRGMTVEQIATLHGLDVKQVEVITKDVSVEREVTAPMSERIASTRRTKPRIPIDFELVERLLREGVTLPKVAEEIGVKYVTLRARIYDDEKLKGLALKASNKEKSRRMSEMRAAKQEVAVTTEVDGFSERYTVEQLSKEEPKMTEAIAEVKKDVQEAVPAPVETTEGVSTWELLEEAQRKENAKWIHFIASQMQNAVITSTLDVEDRNGQLVKVEKVTFTRVQTL